MALHQLQEPNKTMLKEQTLKWFALRGIGPETLEKMKVTESREWMPQEDGEMNTINFNYYLGGELINTKYRDGKKNFKLRQGAQKIFYNLDSIIGNDVAIVVEGEMDALSFIEAGVNNVVSVPNGATTGRHANLDYLDHAIDLFEDKQKVILCLDNDEPGQALQQEFIRRLGSEICYLADLGDVKDANEYLLAYGADKLRSVVDEAPQCPLDNVVTVKEMTDELKDFVKNGFTPGYQIGLEGFDDIFSTYTGQFITVTGIPSSGKSDFVDRMAVGYNMNYGWKTAFASPENKPNYLHAHKLIRKYWGGMPQDQDIDGAKWNEVIDHVDKNYFFIDMERYHLDHVLEKGAELVKRKGIKCLVIDPFNKVTMKGVDRARVNEYTQEYIAKIDHFATKYDVLVIVVAHPNKMYKDQNGKVEEPSMYSIKGGGEWYDSSYHGLLVHRDYDAGTVKVKVLKVKFQNLGENGAEAHFTWDMNAGNYVPLAHGPAKSSNDNNDLPF